jgi:hypothetical protein
MSYFANFNPARVARTLLQLVGRYGKQDKSEIATLARALVHPEMGEVAGYINTSGAIVLSGAATISGFTTLTGGFKGGIQALTAAGAVNLTTLTTTIASAGAIALTLADGSPGQVKIISMITDGGDATLTPTNLQGGTTLTFGDVGDTVTLVFVGTKWAIIGNTGATLA